MGNSHHVSLTRAGVVALLAVLLGLLALQAGAPGGVEAAPPTPVVSIYHAGNSFDFTVSNPANVPVAWEITLGTSAPSGSPPTFSKPLASASSGGVRKTVFTHRFGKLPSGVDVHYIVKATDASGQSSFKIGKKLTLGRVITFGNSGIGGMTKVTVTKDGDPEWYRGDGEIRFSFAVNNCWQTGMTTGWRSMGDGDSFYPSGWPNPSKPHYNDPNLLVAVMAVEEDGSAPLPPGGTCGPILPGVDSGNEWVRAIAVNSVRLAEFDHTTNDAHGSVTFESPAQGNLRFRVELHLEFLYYPMP